MTKKRKKRPKPQCDILGISHVIRTRECDCRAVGCRFYSSFFLQLNSTIAYTLHTIQPSYILSCETPHPHDVSPQRGYPHLMYPASDWVLVSQKALIPPRTSPFVTSTHMGVGGISLIVRPVHRGGIPYYDYDYDYDYLRGASLQFFIKFP